MPDLQDQPARDATDPATPTNGGAESPGVDHLSNLFTMSTTSAAASTEYAAINNTSVVALLLGLASVVALFDWLLLVVPAAAVVVGVVALVQIRRSNGTQTGRGMALLGVVLGVLLGAVVGVRAATEAARTRADREQIAQVISTLGRRVSAGEYDAAYAMFSEKFRQAIPRDRFVQTWSEIQNNPAAGRIESITWNGRAVFDHTAAGTMVAGAGSDWRWANVKDQTPFYQMVFIKSGDAWLIDGIPDLFKLPRKKRGAAGNAAPDATQSPADKPSATEGGASSPDAEQAQ